MSGIIQTQIFAESEKDLNILNFIGNSNVILGIRLFLPAFYKEWSKCRKFFWNVYLIITMGIILIIILTQLIRIKFALDDVGTLCSCIVGSTFMLQLLLKLLIFRQNENLLEQICHELHEISLELIKNPLGDDKYLELYNKYYRRIKISITLKGTSEVLGTFVLILIFIVIRVFYDEDFQRTPAMSWTPYDNSLAPLHALTCMLEFMAFGLVQARNAGIDALFLSILCITVVQLQYLKQLMKAIFNENFNHYSVISKYLAEDNSENLSKAEHSQRKIEEEKLKLLIWWIRIHQRILRLINKFEAVTSPYLAVAYFLTLTTLMGAGFVAVSTSSWTVPQKIIINTVIISYAFQLYVLSVIGDTLTEAGENVTNGGFNLFMFRSDRTLRQSFLFVISRAKKSIIIRFAGINPLASSTFAQLIRMTLTYFITIVQLRQEQVESVEI